MNKPEEIEVKEINVCPCCEGQGLLEDEEEEICPVCGGAGKVETLTTREI